ncbi:cytochrome b-c1 complex subunit 8 [Platysternon megacephalum]|uniref:Cytochrome b-c1 complex subunit 8 n=1 Tax=Platysternon megacephalum TaxID=55544 RepID=A0A4D9EN96_9SAUR|nr:cytochrome b-c1 complex subunit 8 [Platysternon megacephalum]
MELRLGSTSSNLQDAIMTWRMYNVLYSFHPFDLAYKGIPSRNMSLHVADYYHSYSTEPAVLSCGLSITRLFSFQNPYFFIENSYFFLLCPSRLEECLSLYPSKYQTISESHLKIHLFLANDASNPLPGPSLDQQK